MYVLVETVAYHGLYSSTVPVQVLSLLYSYRYVPVRVSQIQYRYCNTGSTITGIRYRRLTGTYTGMRLYKYRYVPTGTVPTPYEYGTPAVTYHYRTGTSTTLLQGYSIRTSTVRRTQSLLLVVVCESTDLL